MSGAINKSARKIYLDYAATTPVDPRVRAAMEPYFSDVFGNPGSLHRFGQEASRAVYLSRRKIAEAIGANYEEIIFTGSATESNNVALRGITQTVRRLTQNDVRVSQREVRVSPRIVVSAIEHESILETAKDLEKEGVEVIYLPVNREGLVNLDKLKNSLNERTVLVSVMYANNEIGSIQPISEIAKIIKGFRVSGLRSNRTKSTPYPKPHTPYPIFHADAVQALQYLDCGVNNLGVDLMTLSAHKIYGPKGIGALYVRGFRGWGLGSSTFDKKTLNPKPYTLNPIITGGGQEKGLRSGTENVPYIVGFAKAVELAAKIRERESARVLKLRDYFWESIKKIYPKAELNGCDNQFVSFVSNSDISYRLPNNLNIYFPNHKAEELTIKLDLSGIAASAGSACSSRAAKPSHVLSAIGLDKNRAARSLRFTLGRPTTKSEIDRALKILNNILK